MSLQAQSVASRSADMTFLAVSSGTIGNMKSDTSAVIGAGVAAGGMVKATVAFSASLLLRAWLWICARMRAPAAGASLQCMTDMRFIHLHVHSNFSLLDGAAPVDALAEAAAQMDMGALALTDHDGLYGAVRFYQAAIAQGIKPIIGVEMTVEPVSAAKLKHPAHLLLLAENDEGYGNLCRLVTAARLGTAQRAQPFSQDYAHVDRDKPVLSQENLMRHCSHLIALSGCRRGEIAQHLFAADRRLAERVAHYYGGLFGPGAFYIELHNHLLPPPWQDMRYRLADLARRVGLPVVATNNVHYVSRQYSRLQDLLVCIRTNKSVDEPQAERKINSEYDLKSPARMHELFADLPEALQATCDIAQRCNWKLDIEHFHFPRFNLAAVRRQDCGRFPPPTEEEDARGYLRRLCYAGAKWRYAEMTPEVGKRLEHELKIIEGQGLCDYFLIVWDIVRFARSRGIRATGRGSAGDSLVSYVLDITHADPLAHELLFERFLSAERHGMPDIDIDFCARRRDEVTAYIYRRYGAEHVAAVCTINTFGARSAIREIGKALSIPDAELGPLAEAFPYIRASQIQDALVKLPEAREAPVDLSDKGLLLELCEQISGFPRHLSVHVGGLVISEQPLTSIAPLELAAKGIVIAGFDKDDIETLGLLKMDILGLRIHTAIEYCLDEIERRTGKRLGLERIPLDDEAAFRLLRSTRTVGLFQLESPGQRNLLGRAQPSEFEEIIANISLFRPGPVQSDMITPYLRRKHGQEPVTYLHPALEPILRRTFGVIIYQEQVIRIAQAIAGFTLGQGDLLRRAMTHDRSAGEMESLRGEFVEGAIRRGVDRFVADRIFDAVSGFAAYGFNKAHAACFARISYETAYLKAHYPADFLAGILSSEPMGFYPARTIAEEAKRLGIGILPVCVNRSEDHFTVENGSIRVGLRLFRGMSEAALQSILQTRKSGLFKSLRDFCQRTSVPRPVVENLILAGAFQFTNRTVPQLLWTLAALPRNIVADRFGRRSARALDFAESEHIGLLPQLQPQTEYGRVGLELKLMGVSTGPHPFVFWRKKLDGMGVLSSTQLYSHRDGENVKVAGIVVARARPPTRSGRTAIFISLEDEKGLVDAAVFEDTYQRYGRELYASPVLMVEGKLSRQGKLDISIIAGKITPLGGWDDLQHAEEQESDRVVPVTFPSKNGGR